jgi:glycosyltransferase involved in cell wall biosynthesis
MKSCVVIPAFNEAKKIGGLIQDIISLKARLGVVVIDDGSKDNTADIAEKYGATVIRNRNNAGKGFCLAKGFEYALKNNFDAVINMDGDGQHLASEIPKFLNLAMNSENSVFIGNRMPEAKNMPALRLATNKVMSWLISAVAGQDIPDTQCGFRLIKRNVLEKIRLTTSKYETESEILIRSARAGFKIISLPIKTIYDGEVSQINPFTDTVRFIKYISKELWTSKS